LSAASMTLGQVALLEYAAAAEGVGLVFIGRVPVGEL
jgi:hypothetical protein